MKKPKVLIAFGTRPEAIKMAPVVIELQKHSDKIETLVCVTAQHREMLDQVLDVFEITTDIDLNIMRENQSLCSLTSDILDKATEVFRNYKPDIVLVHGDTTTTFTVALAAFYEGITVAHVEAGLRTHDKTAPFPEEMNRQITSRLADLHFAPTDLNRRNLLKEGIEDANIHVTGNTVIDALLICRGKVKGKMNPIRHSIESKLLEGRKLILVTGHRRENHGQPLNEICEALIEMVSSYQVQVIYPVHPNPKVSKPVKDRLEEIAHVHLIDPLPYDDFVWLMDKSDIILTDSGGIQEEAPSLGKPVLVMREKSERPEAIQAGTAKLVGSATTNILAAVSNLLNSDAKNLSDLSAKNPYGNGKAAQKIINHLMVYLNVVH